MSSSQHNKKRNASLVYEFLVRHISHCIVEKNEKEAQKTLRLIKQYYRPGTELYKEHRLINALVNTSVSSAHVASTVMNEAKAAALGHNVGTLNAEKTSLIHAINKRLGASDIYEHHVPDYKAYATAQTLLNMWRHDDPEKIATKASYEDQVFNRLIRTKENESLHEEKQELSPGSNRLLFRVMLRKLNEKYSHTLTQEQKQLLKAYAFSSANNDDTVVKKMVQLKEQVIEKINSYLSAEPSGYVSNKLNEAKQRIQLTEPQQTDECMASFMMYAKLLSELGTEA